MIRTLFPVDKRCDCSRKVSCFANLVISLWNGYLTPKRHRSLHVYRHLVWFRKPIFKYPITIF